MKEDWPSMHWVNSRNACTRVTRNQHLTTPNVVLGITVEEIGSEAIVAAWTTVPFQSNV